MTQLQQLQQEIRRLEAVIWEQKKLIEQLEDQLNHDEWERVTS